MPVTVQMPSLIGKNGAVAQDRLESLGVTDVTFGSADPNASVVLLPQNWKVVKQSPAPGARMKPGGAVVLTCVKLA
ncbi:PASTA domain-containing protein [Actinomadura parmotrematis]|uniref:PASTA domain-containing protein n=1 Tax=Actinomadura parmotrematis TaxID=2864039 RepID=A0ABS7G355_9ACTN|nr:PASTA domain-containing protein [Actinomadura parmotrematis]MBW8486976.1 PASTA domain-containing protein [Actinomadura parmotrematis]